MIRALAVLTLLLLAVPSSAGSPISVPTTCPIGGERFEYGSAASYSIFGYRADGKPFGSWEFPLELPVCPKNGLVMFDEFTPDELKLLASFIAEPGYRAISSETSYYRAWWLMKRLVRPADATAWMLVQASWQSDDDPARKARYQALYADEIRALSRGKDELGWLLLQGRAANALRELGRFDEAAKMLDGLPLDLLKADVPLGLTGEAQQAAIEDAERRRDFLGYFDSLNTLIAERNAASEPLRMMGKRDAAKACSNAAGLSDADKAYCATPEMKALRGAAPT